MITFNDIVCEVSFAFDVKAQAMLSKSRRQKFVRPRAAVAVLARELTEMSLPQIGRRMGGRDHTTIINAHRRGEQLAATCDEFAASLESARKRLVDTNTPVIVRHGSTVPTWAAPRQTGGAA